ncbi:uncharacterized protein FTOL_13987 [Fusarium torulosum]|uniref:Uncharacterized protein n=1 Tax=Fusarium torulosum TaxID=33205 RepID=A0AAE8MPJ6_9HYPO|nr:uncharacterized protein FTOL_13987 [Fusarium torulosum]
MTLVPYLASTIY